MGVTARYTQKIMFHQYTSLMTFLMLCIFWKFVPHWDIWFPTFKKKKLSWNKLSDRNILSHFKSPLKQQLGCTWSFVGEGGWFGLIDLENIRGVAPEPWPPNPLLCMVSGPKIADLVSCESITSNGSRGCCLHEGSMGVAVFPAWEHCILIRPCSRGYFAIVIEARWREPVV